MIRKTLLAAVSAASLAFAAPALAQSSPGLVNGQVPTASQWNSYFSGKQNYNPNYLLGPGSASFVSGHLATFGSSYPNLQDGGAIPSLLAGSGITITGGPAYTVASALSFTAGSGITITGGPSCASGCTIAASGGGGAVTSFNTRTGAVSLLAADVTSVLSGATLSGKLTTATPGTSAAPINIPHGSAPTTPTNGDIWTTTGGLFARINGATQQYAQALGYTPLNPANNLSDVTTPVTALTNIKGGEYLIGNGSFSAVPSFAFNVGGCNVGRIVLKNILPSASAVFTGNLSFDSGSTYKSGSSDYAWGTSVYSVGVGTAVTGSNADVAMTFGAASTVNPGSAAARGGTLTIDITGPAQTGYDTAISWTYNYWSAANTLEILTGASRIVPGYGSPTNLKITTNTGTIAGTWASYCRIG